MFFFSIRCSFLNNRDKTEKMYDFGFIIIFVVTPLLKTILGILNFYEVLILGLSVREKFFRTFWFFFFFYCFKFFFFFRIEKICFGRTKVHGSLMVIRYFTRLV